jgi:hypothetical protein
MDGGGAFMVQLAIDQRAIRNYFSLFGPLIEEQIATYFNPDFIIYFHPISYSFSFLKDEIIICSIQNHKISDIKRFDYIEFIPDSFLSNLLALNSLPSRVSRYRHIGLDRLRNEMIDELRLGAITTKDSAAVWDDYQLKIRISSEFQMEKVIH